MVFAVQCPEPQCRKFMLVEEHDRGKIVPCLICKTPIRVGGQDPEASGKANPAAGRVNQANR
jgi:hypothetical protein